MDLVSVVLIAIGLALDCFAVSIAVGTSSDLPRLTAAGVIALFFGGFQIGMNLIGWGAGTWLVGLIAGFDHWVAFLLLLVIGAKMILEGIQEVEEREDVQYFQISTLVLLSLATSMDSLGVGLSFALLSTTILVPALIIGVTAFLLSFMGVILGTRLGEFFGQRIEIAGGVILIGIGIRILLQHGIP